MTNRDRVLATLHYQPCDRVPLAHFGFWPETVQKWANEGHIPSDWAGNWTDGNVVDIELGKRLGFDFNWFSCFRPNTFLLPGFETEIVATLPDGSQHVRNRFGVIVVSKPEAGSIPSEIEHTLKDRASWEEHYKWRLQWDSKRVTEAIVQLGSLRTPFGKGGLDFLKADNREEPYGLRCGSLMGIIRDTIGMENLCYLEVDDPELFSEIIDTVGDLCYQSVRTVMETGARFDFGHFWEDVCFKSGPLIRPRTFAEKVGPHYRKITELLRQHGVDIVSVDCDGLIDSLVPIWIQNGVNTMFPIEVGTWGADIRPWREAHGRELRGVGGLNKSVFAEDRTTVDSEIERLKPLVALGGYIPCPDHRIAPDAQWDLVRYYCDKAKIAFA